VSGKSTSADRADDEQPYDEDPESEDTLKSRARDPPKKGRDAKVD
jgi:hypothetical protein